MNSMGLDERFFPRPNEYIPERWLRDTNDAITKGQEFPFGAKPFGFGPRGCIGQRFAELELYIGVTKVTLLSYSMYNVWHLRSHREIFMVNGTDMRVHAFHWQFMLLIKLISEMQCK